MKINSTGLAFIKAHESLRLDAYKDPVGVWTIGWGHTTAAGPPEVRPGIKISRAEAEAILQLDLGKSEHAVSNAVKVPLNDNQFAALVSFAFNVGETNFRKSSVLRAVNARQFNRVPSRLELWNKGGGKVLPGLVRRRKGEGTMFMTPAVPVPRPKPEPPPAAKPAPEYTAAVIRDVQRRLLGHGYVQVGGVDGLMGDRTRSAISDFRRKNGLPEGEHIDEALIAALKRPDAVRPVIAPERANSTLKDLQKQGSEIADSSEKSKKGAIATILAGIGAVISKIVESAGGLMNLGPALEPFRYLFNEYGPYLLGTVIVAMGGFIWWQARRSGKARLKDHKSGNTSIVNLQPNE